MRATPDDISRREAALRAAGVAGLSALALVHGPRILIEYDVQEPAELRVASPGFATVEKGMYAVIALPSLPTSTTGLPPLVVPVDR